MSERKALFIDRTGATTPPLALWEPVVIKKAEIDAEIERLASVDRPANGENKDDSNQPTKSNDHRFSL